MDRNSKKKYFSNGYYIDNQEKESKHSDLRHDNCCHKSNGDGRHHHKNCDLRNLNNCCKKDNCCKKNNCCKNDNCCKKDNRCKNDNCCKKDYCHKREPECKEIRKYDYIVIGTGTAGCLIAKNLAQNNRGNSWTLCIEAGENLNNDPLVTQPFAPTPDRPNTINLLNATDDPSTSYTFGSISTTIPSANLTLNKDNRVRFRVGRALGGSSAKNLLLTVHPSPLYYEELVNTYTDSGWENFEQIDRAIETYIGATNPGGGECRGQNGAIKVSQSVLPEGPNNISPEFPEKMAEIAGIPLVVDYNDCQNTCIFKSSQRFTKIVNGTVIRSFAGNEYLGEEIINQLTGQGINRWKKLRLLTKTTVLKILFHRSCSGELTAKGVRVLEKGQTKDYFADKVILSAGAIHNPAILQLSGIGPQKVLQDADINPVLLNENVGKNFIDHFGPVIVIQIAKNIRPSVTVGFGGFVQINPAGVEYGGERRTVQFITVAGINSISPAFIPALNLDTTAFNYFTLICFIIKPISRGTVNVISNDPNAFPKIDAGFYNTNGQLNSDINVSQQAILYIKNVVDSLNADLGSEVYKIVFPTTEDIIPGDPSLLNRYITGEISVADHPTGTCKMDKDISTSVVDDRLRVRGVENLYCADMSIYPIIPDGNTCYPAYHAGGQLTEFLTGIDYNNELPF